MKKLVLTLGLACLFMVACNNTPKQAEQAAAPAQEQKEVVEKKRECPMHALKEEYAKWDEMDENMKAELNKKACEMFAQMEAKKAECEAGGKACCKEGKEACEKKCAEMTEEQKKECEAKCAEMKAQCEQMKAAWENFANLSVDEQKDLIMKRLEGCCGEKKCCKGEGKKGCCEGKKEGCKGKHEGCEHPK